MIGSKYFSKFFVSKKGLSLIEVLTSVTIFSIVVLTVTGIFISVLRIQRKVLATQEILDQTSYALEYMSRALRMAKKDISGTCFGAGDNYKLFTTATSTGIKFIDSNNNCTEYYLENNMLKKAIGSSLSDLTSAKLKVNYFKIVLDGESQNDNNQPRLTLSFEVESQRLSVNQRQKLRFQTTISQRNLDIKY